MAEQTALVRNSTANSDGSTALRGATGSGSLSAVGRKLFDCCVGRPTETLREAGGTLAFVGEPTMTVFDVIVEATFPETPRVVNSKSLDRYDIDELGFHEIRPGENGGSVTTISAEYEGDLYGLRIVVPSEREDESNRGAGK